MPDKAKPATKVLRMPRDMAPLITREAERQGVSENSYMLAVLAAAVGYKLPDGSTDLALRLSAREAWAYWTAAGNSADDAEEVVGDNEADAFRSAHARLAKLLPKRK